MNSMSQCNMSYFMVDISLPEIDDEFMSLLPAQKRFVEKLIENGMVMSYSLASDRSKLWVIFKGEEVHHIRGLLACFPIIDKVTYNIVPLISHQNSKTKIRSFSLN